MWQLFTLSGNFKLHKLLRCSLLTLKAMGSGHALPCMPNHTEIVLNHNYVNLNDYCSFSELSKHKLNFLYLRTPFINTRKIWNMILEMQNNVKQIQAFKIVFIMYTIKILTNAKTYSAIKLHLSHPSPQRNHTSQL